MSMLSEDEIKKTKCSLEKIGYPWIEEVIDAYFPKLKKRNKYLYISVLKCTKSLVEMYIINKDLRDRAKWQTVLCAGFFLSTKILSFDEEEDPEDGGYYIGIKDLVYISDGSFTAKEIKKVEREMLKMTNYIPCKEIFDLTKEYKPKVPKNGIRKIRKRSYIIKRRKGKL